MNFGKILFSLQCILIASWFGHAFLSPVETDFWLVKDGFALMALEFISVFTLIMVPGLFMRGWKIKKTSTAPLLTLLVLFSMAFIVTYIADSLYLFGYFIISSAIKGLMAVKRRDISHEVIEAINIFLAWGLSCIVAFLISSTADKLGFMAAWGMLYFLYLMIFEVLGLIKITEEK